MTGAEIDGQMGDEPDEPSLHGSAKAPIGASSPPSSIARSPNDERYLFHQVARVMPFMLWVCRPDGEALYVSPQWVTYTGAALDQHLADTTCSLGHIIQELGDDGHHTPGQRQSSGNV